MIISSLYPPNYSDITKAIDLSHTEPIFTYGDTIYNPHEIRITDDMIVHEEVHQKQQELLGPEAWWKHYLNDTRFRISQEIEAYRVQYKYICAQITDKNARYRILHIMATHLSGPMYGKGTSYIDAIKSIRQ